MRFEDTRRKKVTNVERATVCDDKSLDVRELLKGLFVAGSKNGVLPELLDESRLRVVWVER